MSYRSESKSSQRESISTCIPCGRMKRNVPSWKTGLRLCKNCRKTIEKIRDDEWDDTETFYKSVSLKLVIQRCEEIYDGYSSDPSDIEEVVEDEVVYCPLVRLVEQNDVEMTGYISVEANPCLRLYKKALKKCTDTSLYILSAKVIRPPVLE